MLKSNQFIVKTCLALMLSVGASTVMAQGPRQLPVEEPTGYKDTYKDYFTVGVALNFRNVASPEQMVYDLNKIIPQFDVMSFPDHHNFTKKDIEAIRKRAAGRTILTTEKDATRLHGLDNVKVIPIEVEFLDGKSSEFNQIILDYVHKHSRNSVQNQENKE